MDKSFEGLLFSVIVHVLLVLFFLNAKLAPTPDTRATEIVLIEKPASKQKTFVTETALKPAPLDQIKDQADFLSQFTKRVKKQMRAMNNGPTHNAAPKPRPQTQPSEQHRVAGLQDRPHELGMGLQGGQTNQAIRNVAIGQSSIAEYIPGIQEGAFTALNSDQFTYYAFFARMNEQVRNRWVNNVRSYMQRLTNQDLEFLSRTERHTVIEIVLTPDGQFSSGMIANSSGDRELDQTTVQAFRAAAPFPNPPRGMVEADGFIHLKYGFVVHFRPPNFGPAG